MGHTARHLAAARPIRTSAALLLAVTTAAGLALAAPATATGRPGGHHGHHGHHHGHHVRFATFNASLNRPAEGQLIDDLATPDDQQAAAVAEIIQRERPDVLLVNEFDYDARHVAAREFRRNYLEVGHHGAAPIHYRYQFTAPSNTGIPSGYDLNNDGTVGGADDAYGFGEFPGQYGMLVLSRYPIDTHRARTFQKFRWQDMPDALLPDDPATAAPHDWYSPQELAAFRLSSKSHWDLPIRIGRGTVHFLVSHPTPPTFDGPEDRNGTRNHDEIRFWSDYVTGGRTARYVYDDRGRHGGLSRGARFVIAGDMNSDPVDGDSVPGATNQLLDNPRIADPKPTSKGAVEASRTQGGANVTQRGNPKYDTADFSDDPAPGNLRADYVLPRRGMCIRGSGVFWPTRSSPLFRLTGVYPFPSSDHRSVWLDLAV